MQVLVAVIHAEVIVKVCVFNRLCKYTCVGGTVGFVTVNILSKFIIDVVCIAPVSYLDAQKNYVSC